MKNQKLSYASLLFNVLMGVILSFVLNIVFGTALNPFVAGAAWLSVAVILSIVSVVTGKSILPKSTFGVGILKEIWIARLIEKYYPVADWIYRAQDFSAWVTNNVINLGEIGADPNVLVNNSTYPVAFSARTDVPLALSVDYYDTEGTVIRNAEQVQLAYNKMDTVLRQHGNAIAAAQAKKAAWNFSPSANTTNTPVFSTNGYPKTTYAAGARLPFSLDMIINAEQTLDALNVPADGRILVLHTTHKADLLKQDVNLFKGFTDQKSGMIGHLYGFDIYVSTVNPTYNNTTLVKNAYGAGAQGTDAICSFYFSAGEVFYAKGTTDMFYRLRDPEAKGDIVNFQQRFLALPIRSKYNGAIVDKITAAGQVNP